MHPPLSVAIRGLSKKLIADSGMPVSSLIARSLRKLPRFGMLAKAWSRFRFPGLRMGAGAVLNIEGQLGYQSGASIGEGSNVNVRSGSRMILGQDSYVGRYVEICPSGTIRIGDDTSVQDRCILLGDVDLGRYCRIAPNVMISSGRHYFDLLPAHLIRDQDEYAAKSPELAARHSRPVTIEDDCWIGVNSVIMPGVTVGKGAIVGAASVVVRDVEPYTVVAGAPARVVKKRLQFVPPRRVSADTEGDWPYFYSGFDLKVDSIRVRGHGAGMVAQGAFRLYLDTRGATSVHLIARTVGAAVCSLGHASKQCLVGTEFSELAFGLDEKLSGGKSLLFEPASAEAPICVREAWVE